MAPARERVNQIMGGRPMAGTALGGSGPLLNTAAQSADIRSDAEFSALIPPLTDDERRQLEANILADGCRDPLVVWQEESILLDGHNRYRICRKHRIAFDVRRVRLPDRDAAKLWIIRNQLGRRNLTPDQASYLRGLEYEATKQAPHRPARTKRSQNGPVRTRDGPLVDAEHGDGGVGNETVGQQIGN